MPVIDPDGFERLFRKTLDPWAYDASPFEAHKRRVLLRACGPRIRGRTLELACAIGATTVALAPRTLRLTATDAAPTALAEARRRTADLRHVACHLARLPAEMPRGPFDLIVVSELLYYLSERDAARLLGSIERALAPGGRIVVLHHHVRFHDTAQHPGRAQATAARAFARSLRPAFRYRSGRFACAAFAKRKCGVEG